MLLFLVFFLLFVLFFNLEISLQLLLLLMHCNNCFIIFTVFSFGNFGGVFCTKKKKSLYAYTYIQVTCIYKCMYHDLKYECLQI